MSWLDRLLGRTPRHVTIDLTDHDAERAAQAARERWPAVRELATEQHRLARNNHFRQGFEAALAGHRTRES